MPVESFEIFYLDLPNKCPNWKISWSLSLRNLSAWKILFFTEAFKSALRDQIAMTDTSDVATVRMSTYHRQKIRATLTNRGIIDTSTIASQHAF